MKKKIIILVGIFLVVLTVFWFYKGHDISSTYCDYIFEEKGECPSSFCEVCCAGGDFVDTVDVDFTATSSTPKVKGCAMGCCAKY